MTTQQTDSRTWSFAEDEGGITTVTASDEHLTIDRHSGPDCDMSTSEAHYVFVQRAADYPYPSGTTDRTGPYREDATEVHCDDPQRGYDDWLDAELGGLLRSHYLTGQPTHD